MRRAGRALARGFRLSYEHVGMVLVGSALWFLAGLVPLALAGAVALSAPSVATLAAAAASFIVLTSPAFVAVLSVHTRLLQGEEVAVSQYLRAFGAWWSRGAALAAVELVAVVVLVLDILFFLRFDHPALRLAAGLWSWLLAFTAAVGAVAPALMVRTGRGVRTALGQAVLAVLDNPVATGLTLAAVGAVTMVYAALAAPLLLLFAGTVAFVLAALVDELLRRYQAAAAAAGEAGGQASTTGAGALDGGPVDGGKAGEMR